MFDHLTLRASDLAASERFYDTVLGAIGIVSPPDFRLAAAGDAHPVTTGLHIGFRAESRAAVDEFWRAGVEAGYRDDGKPGPRPQYSPDYYGGFLLDPDGNSAEAVHHSDLRKGGAIDHLWIRVSDLQSGRRAFEDRGLQATYEDAGRVRFGGENGSVSLVLGEPTIGLEVYFE